MDTTDILNKVAGTLAELSSDAILLLDKKGAILYVNNRVELWIGYKKEELVGKNIATAGLMPPSSLVKVLKNLSLRFLGKDVPPYNAEFIAKDKRILTSTIKARLIHDEKGKVLGDLAVISDISESNKYEEALMLEKEKTDIYIDIVGVIVVILDKEGKIALLNKKGCEVLKTTKKDAIGKNWFETFIPEIEREAVKEIFSKIIQGKLDDTEDIENKVITSKGEERIITWHNTYLKDKTGNIYATLSSGDDITERAEKEHMFQKRTLELEKMNSLMVGRELKMAELKKEIERLKGGEVQ